MTFKRILSSAVLTLLVCGGLPSVQASPSSNMPTGQEFRIQRYATILKCFSHQRVATESSLRFDIRLSAQQVGHLQVSYHPQFLRLKLQHIEIRPQYRHKRYATKALETLFSIVKQKGFPFVVQTIRLTSPVYLFPLFQQFGFQWDNNQPINKKKLLKCFYLRIHPSALKFPYYQSQKN